MSLPPLARSFALATVFISTAAQSHAAAMLLGDGANEKASLPCRLTVIPPGPVTDKIEVEIRLAMHNTQENERDFHVRFYWDKIDSDHLIQEESVHVSGNSQEIVRGWWATEDHVGQRTLRYQVSPGSDGIAQDGWPLEVIASDTPALPLLQAGWIDPGALIPPTYPQARPAVEQDVRDAVDAMNAVGMKTIVVTYVEGVVFGYGPFYPSKIPELGNPPLSFDVVGLILDQAAKNGQHVFLGLGRGQDLSLTWNGFNDPERLKTALNLGARVATELWNLYSHYPSFYGWYLTHEANDLAGASKYYNPMADILHAFSPDKPVMVSPSGTPILSRSVIRNSHVDIFAYQDAVGAGYVPYQYTFDPERRIAMLPEVFASYRSAHTGSYKHLWSNLEIWEMSGPEYGNAYPADFSRVLRQIQAQKDYVEMITAYEFLGMMERPESTLQLGEQKAVRLYEAYKNYAADSVLSIADWIYR